MVKLFGENLFNILQIEVDIMEINKIDETLSILEHLFTNSSKVPLSGGRILVNADEGLELIEEIKNNLPDELHKAEDITNREELIIENANKNAELIIQKAEEKALMMLNETEIYRKSQEKAQNIVSEAAINAREIKSSTYKYLSDLLNKVEKGLQGCLNDIKTTREVINQSTFSQRN